MRLAHSLVCEINDHANIDLMKQVMGVQRFRFRVGLRVLPAVEYWVRGEMWPVMASICHTITQGVSLAWSLAARGWRTRGASEGEINENARINLMEQVMGFQRFGFRVSSCILPAEEY